jgi:proline iminopeptidase
VRINANGVRIFFDVEGAKLVPDGPTMREKPTLMLLHGGPGEDHSPLKTHFGALSDIAQVIYVDLRGHGRSDRSDSSQWNLAQWANDLRAICGALEIDRPIVFGESFGGFVAMKYATQYPAELSKLILSSTRAGPQDVAEMIDIGIRLGGSSFESLAAAFLQHRDPKLWQMITRAIRKLSSRGEQDSFIGRRGIWNQDVFDWFNREGAEGDSWDLRADLERIVCPTLILCGADDPITPAAASREIVSALSPEIVRFELFSDCGHIVERDKAPEFLAIMREFISS